MNAKSQRVPVMKDTNPKLMRYHKKEAKESTKTVKKGMIRLMKNLNPCNVHGPHKISPRILKVCEETLE